MITPEAWTPVIINSQCYQLNELSALRNTFYPEYKYVCVYVCTVCVYVCVFPTDKIFDHKVLQLKRCQPFAF